MDKSRGRKYGFVLGAVLTALFLWAPKAQADSYNAVTVSSSVVTSIQAANSYRQNATIYNNGSVTVYCGFDTSVSTTTGMPIPSGSGYETANGNQGSWRGPLYCLSSPGVGCNVRTWEWSR